MNKNDLYALLFSNFRLNPTQGQNLVMRHLAAFLLSEKNNPLYLLKGYAGTGKTTVVGALVRVLPLLKMGFVLLAPTGRAAKVLQSYSGKAAYTIHRKIYRRRTSADGSIQLTIAPNNHKNTLFIVDEASMIGDNSTTSNMFASNNLLDDLMAYVQEGENCRLMLIGDHAQLPPVGTDSSPALNLAYLKATYDLTAAEFELDEVMRQELESGILYHATGLRLKLQQEQFEMPVFDRSGFADVVQVGGDDFEDLLNEAFGGKDFGKSVIICRSNRRANNFNQAVRARIFGYEEMISGGELLMVVKNNYYWASESESMGFIANGDMLVVNRISRIEEMYGFVFADADISFPDYPEENPIQVKLLLDTLLLETPSLGESDYRRLSEAIEEDYMDITNRGQRKAKLRSNPYYNALQVKFAYALTCHKTQGGQWPIVFVDGGGLPADKLDAGALRWLYTAVTRATDKLLLVNFQGSFFAE